MEFWQRGNLEGFLAQAKLRQKRAFNHVLALNEKAAWRISDPIEKTDSDFIINESLVDILVLTQIAAILKTTLEDLAEGRITTETAKEVLERVRTEVPG